ncbi:MAG: PAS domain-containing protein [Dehalococcoidia bacterium]|uniref:HAMP domain-containing sensor histidine kinase n=1 Tax=Candidatus Amarobacter glycogenicus TaxID=3140699 RepID=UPI003136858B|nr:PAS domain-containing protein [Dehalococcoidia bacterium]MBK9341535.1 PAS domain-containing protein [Dehalococcoidia bacterium]
MRRDLALRGAAVGLLAAAIAGVAGFIEDNGSLSFAAATVAGLALAGALTGYFAFRGPAQAVRNVAEAAGHIGEGELALRVPDANGSPGQLTRAFNLMAGRIEQLFESVAAEHARLEAVFDASSDAMVALAPDTSVRFLNTAAVELFRSGMAETVGRPFIESARDYELDELVRRVIASRTGEASVVAFGPDRVSLRAAALPIPDGGDWSVLLMLTDLTEVQRVDQVRRDFLSNVSHELRTPLAAIRALVETMEDGVDAEDAPEFLRRIRQQVERLTSLVNELLDLSRIESGAITLNAEMVELSALVAESASLLRTRTEPAEVRIACESDPIAVEADRASLLRVVSNLLDNATKWSPRGSTVRVWMRDEGEVVALCVQDEGPGIPDQDLARVFERFYKGEASRSAAGVGLGLAIVKHLVRAHGGTATVESPPGEGALFTVRLPKVFVGKR